MAKPTVAIYNFNRGILSRLAAARADIKRTAFSAERMTNWIPRVLGAMMFRPGLGYVAPTLNNVRAKFIPFVFATTDSALIEVNRGGSIRVWVVNDGIVIRPSVATAVTNGTFTGSLAGWTASAGATYNASGYAQFVGDGTVDQTLDQTLTVAVGDRNIEHALRIVVVRGPVTLSVGSTAYGSDDYIALTDLGVGQHSLAFTPTGANVYIRFKSRFERQILVDSCTIEAAGDMTLPAPWAANDVAPTTGGTLLRWDQSGDILFVACKGYQQRKIERRGAHSWSIVLYQPEDGPFRTENLTPLTITASAMVGNVTLTASAPLFKSTQVGGLIKHRSTGQRVTKSVSAQNTFSDPVKVVGVGEARRYTYTISGTWVGTVTIQRSVGAVGFWEDVTQKTANDTQTDADGLDNQIIYYRIGIKTGDYTSGTAVCSIDYRLGSITGFARITAFTSSTVVDAEILKSLGSVVASEFWAEGSWSDRRGWPTAGAFYEGRLWWAGKNGIFGSISDAFDSFDSDFEGAAGPINRTIGSGPVDDINWLLPLQRLIAGAQGAEHSIRSTTFDEPLSPTNFNIKKASTQGSAAVPAIEYDSRGIFVQRTGRRIFEMSFDSQGAFDYGATDLTVLCPEICNPGIVALAVQRAPDTRIHAVRSDGTVAIGVIDKAENVLAWCNFETDGDVLDAVVIPGTEEDAVYYEVDRSTTISGGGIASLSPDPKYTTYTVANSFLRGAHPDVAGTGSAYHEGDVLTLSGGTFTTPARIMVIRATAGGGVITSFAVVDPGDYTVTPSNPVSLTGGSGSGAPTCTAYWGSNGSQVGIDQTSGIGYATVPAISFVGGGGAGAAATTNLQVIGTIFGAGSGVGFVVGDILTVVGGTYTRQATMRVLAVSGGAITFLGVVDPGEYSVVPNYDFTPVTFTGGSGTGGADYIRWGLGNATISTGGSGYSSVPVVSVTGGLTTVLTSVPGSYTATLGESAVTRIYLEKWALMSECVGGTLNKQADSFATYTGASTNTPTGFAHLNGTYVVAWGNGADLSPDDDDDDPTTYLVSSGSILLPTAVTSCIVGLPYTGTWCSSKLSTLLEAPGATSLTQRKKIGKLGLILADTHINGLRFGNSNGGTPEILDPLPRIEAAATQSEATVYLGYDADMIDFPGEWATDNRLWLEARAPRCATVLAAAMAIDVEPTS